MKKKKQTNMLIKENIQRVMGNSKEEHPGYKALGLALSGDYWLCNESKLEQHHNSCFEYVQAE